MNKLNMISEWKAPIWHQDFGNSLLELNLLKEVCSYIIRNFDIDYYFKLDCFEEGYMAIEAIKNETLIYTIQVVDVDSNKIGLFFEEGDDVYIYKISDLNNPALHDAIIR